MKPARSFRPPSFWLALALSLWSCSVCAQVYKCVQGKTVVFADQPCATGTQSELKKAAGIPQSDIQFDVVTTHYALGGNTYAEVYRRLVGHNAGGFAGWAKWDVTYKFDTVPRPEGCSVDRVHLLVKGQVMMPRWDALAEAAPADQGRWQTMYAQLKRHEDGHIQNGRDFAALLRERLLGIGTVPCDNIQSAAGAIYRKLYSDLEGRDAEYDRRTQHGIRE